MENKSLVLLERVQGMTTLWPHPVGEAHLHLVVPLSQSEVDKLTSVQVFRFDINSQP